MKSKKKWHIETKDYMKLIFMDWCFYDDTLETLYYCIIYAKEIIFDKSAILKME